ncbi:hypothetical protein T265_05512 [Opisthorchis viverrini]|uniref:Uncharacterized protein n=1 Tax=Opisthorchis viverrini TaxID=6198 RepID=A0A074ZK27_OPIVI|nr:hypothetical protein T265_05512 [Opisthorchis viverrini]KER27406.1 hypothetical protein T265_05512 [Opisthorchis viverrini]
MLDTFFNGRAHCTTENSLSNCLVTDSPTLTHTSYGSETTIVEHLKTDVPNLSGALIQCWFKWLGPYTTFRFKHSASNLTVNSGETAEWVEREFTDRKDWASWQYSGPRASFWWHDKSGAAQKAPAVRSRIKNETVTPYCLRTRVEPTPYSQAGRAVELSAPGRVPKENSTACCPELLTYARHDKLANRYCLLKPYTHLKLMYVVSPKHAYKTRAWLCISERQG